MIAARNRPPGSYKGVMRKAPPCRGWAAASCSTARGQYSLARMPFMARMPFHGRGAVCTGTSSAFLALHWSWARSYGRLCPPRGRRFLTIARGTRARLPARHLRDRATTRVALGLRRQTRPRGTRATSPPSLRICSRTRAAIRQARRASPVIRSSTVSGTAGRRFSGRPALAAWLSEYAQSRCAPLPARALRPAAARTSPFSQSCPGTSMQHPATTSEWPW
jgi:hypothetical protein